MPSEDETPRFIPRGDKSSNIAGTLTFVGLRAIDPLLQYAILANGVGAGVITTLRGSILAQGPASSTGIALLDSFQLSPYRLALLGMAVGSSAKHIIWKLFIGEERMPVGAAAIISVFNTVFNSLNMLAFTCTATSTAASGGEGPGGTGWPEAPLVVGSALFVTGFLTELGCEFQRKAFKSNPENKGKPYTGGLFGLARHINYTGYTMWRAGFALAAGGWIWGALVGSFFTQNFINQGIPELDDHCSKRYGTMWVDYKKKTPYKLLPYVY